MYREIKALEDKFAVRFASYDDAVRLLQEFANRQPTTEAVNENLHALDRLTQANFKAERELTGAKFEGSQIALEAALLTRKEATEEIKANFGKQFESISKQIDGLKERIDRSEGKSTGLDKGWGVLVSAAGIVGIIVTILLTRT